MYSKEQRKKYIQKGSVSLMNNADVPRKKLKEGNASNTSKEVAKLKFQIQDMQLEMDILKEAIEVLKKDP